MARKYIDKPGTIGWESDDPGTPLGDAQDYIAFEMFPGGLQVASFTAPALRREEIADLRDWLTAWLERTK